MSMQNRQSTIVPSNSFFGLLNQQNRKVDRIKAKHEEIAIKKLEIEADIRKRNEDVQKKLMKIEKFEFETKQEMLAKSMQMSHKREEKIKVLKQQQKQKDNEQLREMQRMMELMHKQANNIVQIELEKKIELRQKEVKEQKKRDEAIRRRELLLKQEDDALEVRLQSLEYKCKLSSS